MEANPLRKMANQKIRKWDIFRVFLRSFFMQSVWNYRSLISVGFGVCLIPIVKRLYSDTQSRKAFMGRHLKFFNSHPYMASYALGVSIRMEEAFAAGETDACEKLDHLKSLLISILGAVGDNLFWFAIRPFSLLIGISALFVLKSTGYEAAALAGTFLIYNIPHISLRYKGILEGYKYGEEIYKCFTKERFDTLRYSFIWVGVFAFLLFLAVLIIKITSHGIHYPGIMTGAAFAYGICYRFTRKFYFSVALIVILSIIAGIIIN
jgi:mannose/fructose/N-acetylgalactosamine-specific phosphotransferase system component IID